MPKNKVSKLDRSSVRIPFRTVFQLAGTLTSGFYGQTISVNPTIANRLTSIRNNYGLYRIEELHVKLYPITFSGSSANVGVALGVGYNAEQVDTVAVSISEIGEYEHVIFQYGAGTSSAVSTGGTTVPTSMTIPFKTLVTDEPGKWWKSALSSNTESWDETQGQLRVIFDDTASSTSGVASLMEVWGVCAFSSPMTASQVPFESHKFINGVQMPSMGIATRGGGVSLPVTTGTTGTCTCCKP